MTGRAGVDVGPRLDRRGGPAVLVSLNGAAALLSPLEVGQLRAALRDAVFDAAELAAQLRAEREQERRRA